MILITLIGFFIGTFMAFIGYSITTWEYWIMMALMGALIGASIRFGKNL